MRRLLGRNRGKKAPGKGKDYPKRKLCKGQSKAEKQKYHHFLKGQKLPKQTRKEDSNTKKPNPQGALCKFKGQGKRPE